MAELTTMSMEELSAFSAALESFAANINSHCSTMEQGISECALFMKDEDSQKALSDAAQICIDIRSTLSPAQALHHKVLEMISRMINERPTM